MTCLWTIIRRILIGLFGITLAAIGVALFAAAAIIPMFFDKVWALVPATLLLLSLAYYFGAGFENDDD